MSDRERSYIILHLRAVVDVTSRGVILTHRTGHRALQASGAGINKCVICRQRKDPVNF